MNTYIQRILKLSLPKGQSAFLWGPRQTGKSTFLKQKFPQSHWINLLNSKNYLKYNKEPWRLSEEIVALDERLLQHPIVIDEIQRVPHY